MGEKKLSSIMLAAALVIFAPGCGDGNGGDEDADADAQPDTDAAEDLLPDPDAAEEPADVPSEDGVEDPVEEEAPATCSGSDTLTLEFVDGDGSPVEGVAVALRCLSEVSEATSGSDGRVSFDNLDLAETPVDFTYVYWDMAFSVVGMGGETPAPDPLQISLALPWREESDSIVFISGSAVHSTTGSVIMVVSSAAYANMTATSRYEISSETGTDLGLTAFEYVIEEDSFTMVGYSYQTYDLPSADVDGPDAAPSSTADIGTATLQIDYDLAADSPLLDKCTDRIALPGPAACGAIPMGFDALGNLLGAGLTSSWIVGETSDTLEVSWIQEGLDAVATNLANLYANNSAFTAGYRMRLPLDPADYEAAYTVHDVPVMPGQEPGVAFAFDQTIDVVHPDWAAPYSVMAYNLRLSGTQPNFGEAPFFWCVSVHPDTTSFSFAQLPLPSTLTYEDLFYTSLMYTGVAAVAYDQDPVQDAEIVVNTRCGLVATNWGPLFYKESASDLRYRIYAP